MPTQILMPQLSPTMEEGKLAKWHVKEGDEVRSGDVLVEIETDKATMEVEAPDDGTIDKLLVAEGTEHVPVNYPIAHLLTEDEGASSFETRPAAAPRDEQNRRADQAQRQRRSRQPRLRFALGAALGARAWARARNAERLGPAWPHCEVRH